MSSHHIIISSHSFIAAVIRSISHRSLALIVQCLFHLHYKLTVLNLCHSSSSNSIVMTTTSRYFYSIPISLLYTLNWFIHPNHIHQRFSGPGRILGNRAMRNVRKWVGDGRAKAPWRTAKLGRVSRQKDGAKYVLTRDECGCTVSSESMFASCRAHLSDPVSSDWSLLIRQ